MRPIDADALIMRLSDWALGASPNESDRGETRALRQREYDTIEHCVGVIVSAPTVGGWISVKDRLPNPNHDVLVCVRGDGYSYYAIAWLYPCGGWDSNDEGFNQGDEEIIKWMELPEEENNETD